MTLYEHVKQQPVQWIASISSASKPAAVPSAVPASGQQCQQVVSMASKPAVPAVSSASEYCLRHLAVTSHNLVLKMSPKGM